MHANEYCPDQAARIVPELPFGNKVQILIHVRENINLVIKVRTSREYLCTRTHIFFSPSTFLISQNQSSNVRICHTSIWISHFFWSYRTCTPSMMQIMQRSHRSLCHHCLLFLRHGNVFKRAERSGTACHKFFQNEPHRMQRFSTSSSPTSTRNDDLEYVDDDKFHDMSTEDQLDYIEKMEVQARMEELQANPRPWANLLGYPSRARWRVTKDYPKQLIGERASILNETHRTSRQFKRAIESWLNNSKN